MRLYRLIAITRQNVIIVLLGGESLIMLFDEGISAQLLIT